MSGSLNRGLWGKLKQCLQIPREPDFIIGLRQNPYLLRWWVVPRNKWLNIYLHNFLRSDDDRALHDHPWWNVSVLLKGCYVEHTPKGNDLRKRGCVVFRKSTAAHRIELIDGEAWSLFLTGPKIRDWGFHCPQGWRAWWEFVNVSDPGQIGPGCD